MEAGEGGREPGQGCGGDTEAMEATKQVISWDDTPRRDSNNGGRPRCPGARPLHATWHVLSPTWFPKSTAYEAGKGAMGSCHVGGAGAPARPIHIPGKAA